MQAVTRAPARAALLCGAAWLFIGTPVRAQDAHAVPSTLSEVVVTAERRATNIQTTPLAVSALSGDELANRQISDVEALSQSIPNVNLGRTIGIARIAIRGVGLDTTVPGNEGRVAYHLDGVYISRPTAALGTLFDVDRIEVVRGPQGTLYGRNATGGAINVITRDPGTEFGGFVRATVGNYELFRTEGGLDIPVSDAFQIRVAGQTIDRGGYGDNLTTGNDIDDEHTRAARVKVKFAPNDAVSNVLSYDYYNADDRNYGYHYIAPGNPTVTPLAIRLGSPPPRDPRDSTGDTDQVNERRIWSVTNALNWDLGPATLTSLTGYRYSRTYFLADIDNSPLFLANLYNREISEQWSQELRLAGEQSWGAWLLGAYYFNEEIDGINGFSPMSRALVGGPLTPAIGAAFGGVQEADSWAVFGQSTWNVTDRFSLTLGARYTYERKAVREFSVVNFATNYPGYPPPNQSPTATRIDSREYNRVTPRVTVDYKLTDDIFLFATYAQGFKSGGFSLGSVAAPYEPEILTDYEAGIKAEWLGGKARTNISAFWYDYQNLQVQKILPTGTLFENAAKATVKGLEFEGQLAPTENLRFELNVALLDATYDEFSTGDPARPYLGTLNLAGNTIAQSPPYSVFLAGQHTWPTEMGDFTLRAESVWIGKSYFNQYNRDVLSQKAHSKVNLFLNWDHPGGKLTASAFVRNLTDEFLISAALTSNPLLGTPVLGTFEPPRTFGFEVGYKF